MNRVLFAVALLALAASTGGGAWTTSAHAATTSTNWDPSGQPMPVGNLPGWHQIFADNFANQNYPLGSFTGCRIAGCAGTPSVPWGATVDGYRDTSGHCEYYASKTVSITQGILDIWMHTNALGTCLDANLWPNVPHSTYLRYSTRFRADAVAGYKLIDLLWPVNHISGAISLPENDLNDPIHGFLHAIAGGPYVYRALSSVPSTSWHTVTLEWTPTRVTFLLDGVTIGTTTNYVPQSAMYLNVRAESQLQGAPKPPASAQGHLQIDWFTAYSYDPTTATAASA